MLEKAVLISLIVFALYACMQEGMIFGVIQRWMAPLTDIIGKPLYRCVICMTPWYGSGAYWIIWGDGITDWLVVISAATGVNALMSMMALADE